MKKLRLLGIALCAVAAATLTSCWDDDDDNTLSAEEKLACFNATRGQHSGNLIFRKASGPNDTNANDIDTLSARWNITSDSTMVFQNVPVEAIASAIDTISTAHKAANLEAYRSLLQQPAKDINCGIYYYSANPVSWLVYPAAVTYDNVAYNGKTCKLQIVFASNVYSFGSCSTTGQRTSVQIVVAGAYVDGTYDSNLIPQSNARALLFSEVK